MLIVRRISRGVADHFPIRVSEWVMVHPTFWMGVALMAQPDIFDSSPSFAELARWADERVWSSIAILCAFIRFTALMVNGTFRGFTKSPHLRAFASFVGVAFWSQVTLGFAIAAGAGEGAWTAVAVHSTLLLLELVNVHRSFSDIGKSAR
ncbi:hypothetical protein DLJ53_17870 [Acuticoccus sediminis]|uniref:Uncharacterized protein n=2 Tax=Acuticoccus sediminis TaxID=2184697 RepID=A0A8B2NUD3_9HYPH|nr:hypothetical protein DLJ53_17870 [Acuticoccus sediminis]